jgi:Ca-activated chloride channel family protein
MFKFNRKALQYFAALGVLSLLSLQTNGQDAADEILRIDTNLVNLFFTAFDRDNRLITNLTREDLKLFEDGKAQKILLFESETNRALNVAILVDISGSQKTTLELEKTTIRAFVESVLQNRDDKVALISFAADPFLEQPLTSNLSATQQALERVKTIRGVIGYQGSGTILPVGTKPAAGFLSYTSAIWDAIAQSCRNVLKPASVDARRIIVIVTDGNDTSSRSSLEEAIDATIQSDAIVYAIGVGDSSLSDGVNRETLKRLSFETGGRFFAPKRNEDLNEAFKKIATELRSQYLVTYVPQKEDQAGSSYRRIRLAVNKGKQTENLRLVYRSGYYFKGR